MRMSDEIHLFQESEPQQVLACDKKLCVSSLLALAKSSETAPLRPLPPPIVHFKIRVLTFAVALWDLLADTGLDLNGFDVGAGFVRGQGLSWSCLRF